MENGKKDSTADGNGKLLKWKMENWKWKIIPHS